jgi:alkylation response protein AidB-like acyl-CoA dehydrogenase
MSLAFPWTELPAELADLRREVRAFLQKEIAAGAFTPASNAWVAFDRDFSRKCGERGLIGMTWPEAYGGRGLSIFHQFVVTEELLAAGAPVTAHWMADRQFGPQLLRFGSEAARQEILPSIVRGEVTVALGMSEPNAGSDLSAASTRAERAEGGWHITGAKIWTTNAHRADYMSVLARTSPLGDNRRQGLTQFIVGLPDPAVEISPIYNQAGRQEFNEVRFDGAFVADDMVVGEVGEGWHVVTSELALERSAPDRLMSSFDLLRRLTDAIGADPEPRAAEALGRLVTQLQTLRYMSRAVAGMIAEGRSPVAEAAMVKDLGTSFEQKVPEAARRLVPTLPSLGAENSFEAALADVLLAAPSFSLRGGTREILRTLAARELR